MSTRFGASNSQQLWQTQTLEQQRQQAENEQRYYQQQEPVDFDIYNKAIAVSSPRFAGIDGNVDPNATISKSVIRRVEVPFTRPVTVPTQVVRVVPTTVEQKVPVRKLIEVPTYQTVAENYVEYEEREAVREKEIWVKKIVPERYIERVPVQKVRQVQKPTTVIREIESWETVQVPTTKRVLVDGYRVDQVPDSKLVEVEEQQRFALRPEPIDEPHIVSTRDLGRLENSYSHLQSYAGTTTTTSTSSSSFSSSNRFEVNSSSSSSVPPPAVPPFQGSPSDLLRSLGLGVDETHTRHTDGTGVVVTRIDRGGLAARAGLQVHDIITSVNGRPTTTVFEFVTLLTRIPGPVKLTVNRDGRRNLTLNFTK